MNHRQPEGFILVATLWLMAGLALLASYLDGITEDNVTRAVQVREAMTMELDLRSTEATLIYLLATNRVNHRGFILDRHQTFADRFPEELPTTGDGELWVTDQIYRGLGDTAFSVQYESGLVSINMPATHHFAALLRHAGVGRTETVRLAARLRDYTDTDSALSLNGAEAFDYERNRLKPPSNWMLATPLEARRILGFDKIITPGQWQFLEPLLTVRPMAGYNFNTMAPEIIGALLGLPAAELDAVIDRRRTLPITSLSQVMAFSSRRLPIDEEEVITIPGRDFRISLWHTGATSRRLIGIRLIPNGEFMPWRIDYRYSQQNLQNDSTVPASAETALL
jgi:hypothetical protein